MTEFSNWNMLRILQNNEQCNKFIWKITFIDINATETKILFTK
jgi:hypothetical protein